MVFWFFIQLLTKGEKFRNSFMCSYAQWGKNHYCALIRDQAELRASEWSWPSENHTLVTSQAAAECQPPIPSVPPLSLRWWSGLIYKTCGCYELLLLVRRIGNILISRLPFKYSNSFTSSIWQELLFFHSDVFQCALLNSKSTSGLDFENANCIRMEREKGRKLS